MLYASSTLFNAKKGTAKPARYLCGIIAHVCQHGIPRGNRVNIRDLTANVNEIPGCSDDTNSDHFPSRAHLMLYILYVQMTQHSFAGVP